VVLCFTPQQLDHSFSYHWESLPWEGYRERHGREPPYPVTSLVSFLGEPEGGIPVPDWAFVRGPMPESETGADWEDKWELYYDAESFFYYIGMHNGELSWYEDHLPEYGWVKMGELSQEGNPGKDPAQPEGPFSYGSFYHKEGSGYLSFTMVGDSIGGSGILLFTPEYPTAPFRDLWFEVWVERNGGRNNGLGT
jgi:hypothetical protein